MCTRSIYINIHNEIHYCSHFEQIFLVGQLRVSKRNVFIFSSLIPCSFLYVDPVFSDIFKKWSFFSSFWQKPEGIFLWYLLWKSGQAPSGKSHNIAGAPYDWVNLEFFIQTCPHWASSNPSIPVQVSLHWCWFPRWLLLMSICSSEVAVLCICLSVSSISGTVVCPLSCGAKKNCWFFSLFSLLLFRMELRLPSSLYEELENPLGLPTSNIILRKYIFSNSQYFWLK